MAALFGRRTHDGPHVARPLPGRDRPIMSPGTHVVLGTPMGPPYPEGTEAVAFGMGCFWGAEELYWQVPGVHVTAAGYAAGVTPNPTYEEVCSGGTAHSEVVLVVFDPGAVAFGELLRVFWEGHDPTQGMRQGNDVGTQYRSVILTTTAEQADLARRSADAYGPVIAAAGYGPITTEIAPLTDFYFAEEYHQQYLAKNPHGYRCHSASGVPFPGVAVADPSG